ncbi:MAG: helix-turn-helix domain-containing protein [Desulfobulbaceae bacterium]|nr:helix-turn-helix domain-containing protein [Desulfobulbaceae bacterium]HIJ78074.1 helix-turn-helix domain-containing protein [Deltaproteobacteria bacterium]
MRRVTILALDDAAATTITGPYDTFCLTGVLWNLGQGQDIVPEFKVEIVTPTGAPARCMNNLTIMAHRAMTEVRETDLILVSAVLDIHQTLARQGEIIEWLKERYRAGAMLASVCTGSFALAETGLLDGKIATTHWRAADEFKALYPKVQLKPERLITDAGDIFCSGGFNSSIDLANYLVEKMCGRETAIQCAKSLVVDRGRVSQTPYSVFNFQREHHDEQILKIQNRLETDFNKDIDLEQLAQRYGMGRRTMERRFKASTGDTPLMYLQRVRVEAAKQKLESNKMTFDEISYQVGYEDTSFFRKIFIKHTTMRPIEYRAKFMKMVDFGAQ